MSYLDDLKENMPIIYVNSCMDNQHRDNYGMFYNYPCDEEDTLNI
jgi:hypothetical protein